MTQHTHREHIDGCFRCDLSRDEAREYEQSTPTTDEVRDYFVDAVPGHPRYQLENERFERWMRSVKADAWDEGREDELDAPIIYDVEDAPPNPYRQERP